MLIFKTIFWFLMIPLGIYVGVVLYLYFNQKNMIFYPKKDFDASPKEFNLQWENVDIPVGNKENIFGWYFPVTNSNAHKVVLFCHGNAGNISHRLSTVQFFVGLEINVFIFDYRGYGQSKGESKESNLYTDARLCYKWLVERKNFQPKDIFILGRSLGGAVAIDLATKVACGGLIVESSFTSATELGKKIFPWFPIKSLVKYRFDSIDKIDLVNCPLLVAHSPEDDMIPFYMGEALFEKAKKPKKFFRLNGLHNEREYLKD
ncbi:MAG: alpha/beta hydrolase, partial [FCB group bacterium]|nr:alpha/beta hydrolase [FCB group bacterium]